jgi:polysaccharide biosynthesis protein PslH
MSSAHSKLKTLVLLNRIPYPLNDGGAIGAFNFVKGYAEAGCEVTMLAMNTAKHFVPEEKAQEVLGKYGTLHLVNIDNRINAVGALANLIKGGSYVVERFVSAEYNQELVHRLQQQKFDVVHVDGLPPAAYIETIRQYSAATVSMRAHNVEHVIWQRIAAREGNLLKRWYLEEQAQRLKEFEVSALGKCDVVMAISNEDEATIQQCSPGAKTVVVPAGMDISAEPENQNYNPVDLFFIGAMDWMPNTQGMDWFVKEVLPALAKQFPQVKVNVAGKKMSDEFKALKSANLLPVGEVPDAKTFMLQHGLMIVPIISGSGIRIKILEGMALGKTILATTIAAEGLGLTNGENILIADTPQQFAAHIQKCLTDAAYCKGVGVNAHCFAYANYRNASIFEKLIAHYLRLK